MSQKPQPRSNLSRMAAKGNGRVQRQCCRALLVHGTISTSDAIAWSYRELMWGAPRRNTLNRAVRRALVSIGAKRVGRGSTIGRPWLWRMR